MEKTGAGAIACLVLLLTLVSLGGCSSEKDAGGQASQFALQAGFECRDVVKGGATLGRGRGAGALDYDRDGKLDMYISAGGMEYANRVANTLCQNVGEVGNWLSVELAAEGRANEGALVTTVAEGATQVRQVGAGAGFGSINSPIVHFGLGRHSRVDKVTVRWPNGHVEEVISPPFNSTVVIGRKSVFENTAK